MTTDRRQEIARSRAKALADLIWHVGAFVIVNAFLWILDLWIGTAGIQWAFWITLFWGFALAFHALTYVVQGRRLVERKTQQYLDEDAENRGT